MGANVLTKLTFVSNYQSSQLLNGLNFNFWRILKQDVAFFQNWSLSKLNNCNTNVVSDDAYFLGQTKWSRLADNIYCSLPWLSQSHSNRFKNRIGTRLFGEDVRAETFYYFGFIALFTQISTYWTINFIWFYWIVKPKLKQGSFSLLTERLQFYEFRWMKEEEGGDIWL